MSTYTGPHTPGAQSDQTALDQTRQQINRLIEEIAKLGEQQMEPAQYFSEFLRRILAAMAAQGGAAWGRTMQGNLQIQYHIGMDDVGLDEVDNGHECHQELLRQVAQTAQPRAISPRSGPGIEQGEIAPANLTNYVLLIAPILVDKAVVGLVEVWHDPNRSPNAQRGFLTFLTRMAGFAAGYMRNNQLRQMVGQQELWTQLEAYSRQIHGSLNPREVSYLIVNEGRRLIDCDRVSACVRQGHAIYVEAISGADVVQKRSNLVQCMKHLFDEVIRWDERLIYSGNKDESLPPRVLEALDTYLAESNSKLLIVMPLRDDREGEDSKLPCRSALMMECFEPSGAVDQLIGRMEVVSRHATPALYNSVEHRRLPFKWFLQPIANIKDSLRGNRLAIAGAIGGAFILFILAMIFVPWQLRMDAEGKLVPKEKRFVYPMFEGTIVRVRTHPGDIVASKETLFLIENLEMYRKMEELKIQIEDARQQKAALQNTINDGRTPPQERTRARIESLQREREERRASVELDALRTQANTHDPRRAPIESPVSGEVVTFDLDRLEGRPVKPGEPLLEIAQRDGPWKYELLIPEAQIGHIREALLENERLTVELALASDPDKTYYGWLYRDGLAGEANVENNETFVKADVEIASVENGGVSPDLLALTPVGAEVRAKIHCGRFAVGYVWFYELWEFFYEHVIF